MKTLCAFLAALIASAITQLGATDLAQQKLYGHWTSNPLNYQMGSTVALSSSYALAGAPLSSEGIIANQGAVQVFNTATSAWVRKLLPPASAGANSNFGVSMAVSGSIAVVGASTAVGVGRAYVYDLSSGALKFTLSPSDGLPSDRFGMAVAITSTSIIVGADANLSKGAVYVFNLSNGSFRFKAVASDGAVNDGYGRAIAAEGNIAVVSAPFSGSSKGAIYAIDLTSGAELLKHVPATAAGPDRVGISLDLHQGKVVMGTLSGGSGKAYTYDLATGAVSTLAPLDPTVGSFFGATVAIHGGIIAAGASEIDSSRGAVYLFDAATGTQLQKIRAVDNSPGSGFGITVALNRTNLLAGAWNDASQGTQAGAAYLVRPVINAMQFTKAVARGDAAPAAPDTTFNTLGDAFINSAGEVALTSTLTGSGSNGGHDVGAYSDFKNIGFIDGLLKSRQLVGPGITVTALPKIIFNHPTLVCGLAQLSPTQTSFWIYDSTASNPTFGVRTGDTSVFGSTVLSLNELVQSNVSAAKNYALGCKLKTGAGLVTTTAANDSAVTAANIGAIGENIRESDPAPTVPATNYGEFTGRLAFFWSRYVYSTALTGDTATNAGIFQKQISNTAVKVVQKHDLALGIPLGSPTAPTISALLGETSDNADTVVYRASIAGSGITSSNNEGLWTRTVGGTTILALRKGVLLSGLTVNVSKIINFWNTNTHVLALVQLAGSGVNSANDMALLLVREDGNSPVLLMREGEAATGCAPATIGTINRVEVDAWRGTYAVLTTLASAPSGTEQALFTGGTTRGDDGSKITLRRPFLRLRKGQLFSNQPGKVKSISLPTSNLTASGAGCTGRGRAISWNYNLAITVEFDNGVRQVMRGTVN